MSDGGWDDESGSSNQRGRGRGGSRGGRGRGSFNRNNDFDSQGEDSWGNGGAGGGDDWPGDNDGDRDGGSRGRGRGRGRGGRGGSRMDRNNGDEEGGEFGVDQQPPVSDKPRPTYVPPEIDENDEYGIGVGSNFDKYENIQVKVSGDSVPKHIESFKSSGLREVLIEKLVKCNYSTPTPIQKYAIPVIISGRDMMATAQTGSGKTVSIVILD